MKIYNIDIIKSNGFSTSIDKYETTVYRTATRYFIKLTDLIGKDVDGMKVVKVKMYINGESTNTTSV